MRRPARLAFIIIKRRFTLSGRSSAGKLNGARVRSVRPSGGVPTRAIYLFIVVPGVSVSIRCTGVPYKNVGGQSSGGPFLGGTARLNTEQGQTYIICCLPANLPPLIKNFFSVSDLFLKIRDFSFDRQQCTVTAPAVRIWHFGDFIFFYIKCRFNDSPDPWRRSSEPGNPDGADVLYTIAKT